MKKNVYLLICILLSAFSIRAYAQVATFTGGHVQNLVVCESSPATSIDTLLRVSDTSTGHTVGWSVFTAPAHGTLVATYTATSTGGTLTPVGLTYMPATGYIGNDTFAVEFADGAAIDSTMVIVSVDTLLNPGTITGPSTVCIGASVTLSDATTGGAWGISNSTASVTGVGAVTGVHAGIDTVRYSLTNVCGIARATSAITVNPLPDAGHFSTPDSVCAGGHLALVPRGDAGGIWRSANTLIATVNDTGLVTGTAPGSTRIVHIVTNGCGSDTAAAEVRVQTPVQPILGGDTVCQFQTLTLIDPSTGGNWTSSSLLVAPVIGGLVIGGITLGMATISYTLHNACGATTATHDVVVEPASYCAVDTTTSVYTMTKAMGGLSIFPNPNNGTFTLNLSSGTNEQATVTITNMVGEIIKEFSTVTNQAVDVQLDKAAGLYFVRASTSGGIYTAKILINQ